MIKYLKVIGIIESLIMVDYELDVIERIVLLKGEKPYKESHILNRYSTVPVLLAMLENHFMKEISKEEFERVDKIATLLQNKEFEPANF